ncbi:unnamed protein product, partial [Ectocarpus sp. 6 AP-2014]
MSRHIGSNNTLDYKDVTSYHAKQAVHRQAANAHKATGVHWHRPTYRVHSRRTL